MPVSQQIQSATTCEAVLRVSWSLGCFGAAMSVSCDLNPAVQNNRIWFGAFSVAIEFQSTGYVDFWLRRQFVRRHVRGSKSAMGDFSGVVFAGRFGVNWVYDVSPFGRDVAQLILSSCAFGLQSLA
jgi:hypothetical protein